ncbi:hypothetical protein [Vibrio parahaemolyticus]|uniref:hypothetical protein n=1 Tax=Vibrio parahaemolyticus TaxID=670 RepID=UPI0011EF60E0|nr:hypothetical protein [Vibrio parahaemolyticus]KAB5599289.1 hypothetical protein F0578_11735 [Vibrio parahaemolyticus]
MGDNVTYIHDDIIRPSNDGGEPPMPLEPRVIRLEEQNEFIKERLADIKKETDKIDAKLSKLNDKVDDKLDKLNDKMDRQFTVVVFTILISIILPIALQILKN